MDVIYEYEPKITINSYIFHGNYKEVPTLGQLQKAVQKSLLYIPDEIEELAEKNNWKLIITNKRNLESEYGFKMKIFGLTDFEKKEIIVYATLPAIEYSIPHEFGHFIDSYLKDISNNKEWLDVYNDYKEVAPQLGEVYYTKDEPKNEFFADSFLTYILNKQALLDKRMFKIVEIFDRILEIIPFIE